MTVSVVKERYLLDERSVRHLSVEFPAPPRFKDLQNLASLRVQKARF